MSKVLFLIVLFGFLTLNVQTSKAEEKVGLAGGSTYFATELRGRLTVFCNEAGRFPTTARFDCSSVVLDPGEMDYVVGPKCAADMITLKSTYQNGKTIKKEVGYNGSKGRTDKRVNLWILTVFQKPLLDFGTNKVDYILSKDHKVIEKGTFNVEVADGGVRTCPDGSINSIDEFDCRDGYNSCQRYFSQYNYCQ